ncbi:hypothetical protein IMSHALPRED_005965 [Imshaugia aleurites]|uniref:Uncharacterized protein n=1 Tax=Imshaugia aleurites TaxID=172621 RepID=A0A8H3J942_9LECA|nr:hypothetical protein IMSHALPRED_005965 [Imshaugia aleurites]
MLNAKLTIAVGIRSTVPAGLSGYLANRDHGAGGVGELGTAAVRQASDAGQDIRLTGGRHE